MLESMRLPDLVLGVSIRADTTGAKQAADDLRKSLNGQVGGVAGAATGGIGTALGAGIGTSMGIGMGNAFQKELDGMMATLSPKSLGILRSAGTFSHVMAAPIAKAVSDPVSKGTAAGIQMGAVKGLRGMRRLIGIGFTYLFGMLFVRTFRFLAGFVQQAAKYVKASGLGGMFSFAQNLGETKALLANVRIQFGLMLAVIFKLGTALDAIEPVLVRVASLFQWIAESPRVQLAIVSTTLFAIAAALALIVVVAGLAGMALAAMAGVTVAGALIALAVAFGVILQLMLLVFGWLVAVGAMMNKFGGKKFLEGGLMKTFWKGFKTIAEMLPEGKGGFAGGGLPSAKMAGAMLEGSVEAYKTIQGTMMRYASETARNTRDTVGALRQILNRAPEMGVVAV